MIETVLSEQTLEFAYDQEYSAFVHHSPSIYLFPNEGETYQVVWDGETFPCVAFAFTGNVNSINMGNPAAFGGENNNYPFIISSNADDGGTSFFALSQESTHTVSIYREVESVPSRVVLYDRDMNPNTYDIDKGIRLFKEDGTVQDFTSASHIETTVQLDFSNGNMEVLPGEGELFSKVTIEKPETLISENIVEDVDIAGIIGTHISIGGGIVYDGGSITANATTNPFVITHNLGVIPDIVFLYTTKNATSTGYATLQMYCGFSTKFAEATGKKLAYMFNTLKPTSSTATAFNHTTYAGNYDTGLIDSGAGAFVSMINATENRLEIKNNSGGVSLGAGFTYNWLAIGGLT